MNTNLFKVLDAGHTYELANHPEQIEDGEEKAIHLPPQIISFIKKEPIQFDQNNTLAVVQEGTTNEAVISMLIDRLQTLNERFPSTFNEKAIHYLHLAYEELVARTADREARGVEGTHQQ